MKFLALLALTFATASQAEFLTPGTNLVIEGIPPIELALTKKVEAYTQFKPSSIVAWHPQRPAMLIAMRPAGGAIDSRLRVRLGTEPADQPGGMAAQAAAGAGP